MRKHLRSWSLELADSSNLLRLQLLGCLVLVGGGVGRWTPVNVVHAEVVAVEVLGREPFASGKAFGNTGPYERIHGRLTIAVDPDSEANARIADLQHAERSATGQVECRSDFFLLKPVDPSRGNGVLLYDVNNRGNKLALEAFNGARSNDPATRADAGDGFLMRHGYSLLWSGWNGEVQEDGTQRLLLELPLAVDAAGQPLTGTAHLEFCVTETTFSRPFAWSPWGVSKPFPAVTTDNDHATLVMRPRRDAEAITIPRGAWGFARIEGDQVISDPTHVYLQDGFRPGWLYDLVYQATDARITGLGFAAIRDSVSFFRYGGKPEISGPLEAQLFGGALTHAYIFGISQSGRVIHHLIYDGFNSDEADRQVFDGALLHVAGAGKGMFNHRFRMTTEYGTEHEGYLSGSEFFPFTPVPQTDPVTGQRGDTGQRARQRGHLPKLIFTQSSTEYWSRAASLLHTDVTGRKDLDLPESMRVYLVASSQHLGGGPATPGICQQPRNPLDDRPPVLRAMLVNLDHWVRGNIAPPPSRYPRLDDGTLVDLPTWQKGFPAIPGVNLPTRHYQPYRLDFGPRMHSEGIPDRIPPHMGPPYPTYVPAVDADGNDIAGIRLPEIAIPLGTHTGWNLRAEQTGAGGVLSRLDGMFVPFAKTKQERLSDDDPRLSLEERYASRDAYLGQLTRVAVELVGDRLLLPEDALQILQRGAQQWRD